MAENTENNSQAAETEQPTPSFQSQEDKIRSDKIQLAKDILRGVDGKMQDMNALYKDLKKYGKFGLARKILYILRKQQPNSLKLYQQEALCTYKDPDLPSEVKFDKAIEILRETEDLETTENTETLGLLGSIYKRKWQFDNQFYNLKKSKYYYLKGHKIWLNQIENNLKDTDYGYTGINAAYVLDLMANLQMSEVEEIGAHEELEENQKNFNSQKKSELKSKKYFPAKLKKIQKRLFIGFTQRSSKRAWESMILKLQKNIGI